MSDWSSIWFISQKFFRNSFVFLLIFFITGETWLSLIRRPLERARLWRSLLLTEEKENSVMEYRQYHGKGLFLRFSYWVSPVAMQAVCTHFSHKNPLNGLFPGMLVFFSATSQFRRLVLHHHRCYHCCYLHPSGCRWSLVQYFGFAHLEFEILKGNKTRKMYKLKP